MKRVALGELSRPSRTRGGRLVNGKPISAAARQSRRKSRGYGVSGRSPRQAALSVWYLYVDLFQSVPTRVDSLMALRLYPKI
jgi:hypothetical protein